MISKKKNNKEKQKKTGYENMRNRDIIVKFESVKFSININSFKTHKFYISVNEVSQMYDN
ncbi:uncharacterized protein CHSO_4273 [Chryseobacterium sp. StRB126]|nr:uncharacterized protein CHSO_4273 [Chryseobacterium sp. StRB126]